MKEWTLRQKCKLSPHLRDTKMPSIKKRKKKIRKNKIFEEKKLYYGKTIFCTVGSSIIFSKASTDKAGSALPANATECFVKYY